MDNKLGEHDPFRGMNTGNKSIRPDFLKSSDEAASKLNGAESAATKEVGGQSDDAMEDAKEAEDNTGGFYSGSGKDAEESGSNSTKSKGIFKRGGPVFTILFVIFIGSGLMSGTQMFQPFSLLAQFEETFNSMHTSANVRSEKFFRYQMSKRKVKSPYNIFGTDFSFSAKQKEKLKEQGIEFDDDYDGKKVLKYTDVDGNEKIVPADDFKRVYSEDADFFQRYNAASMTWRGKIANWFSTTTANFLQNNKLTRNMFEKFKEKVAETDGDSLKATKDIISERTNGDGELDVRVSKEQEDEDGNPRMGSDDDGKIDNEKIRGTDTSTARSKTKDMLDNVKGKFTQAANIGCAALGLIGTVSMLVAANDAIQIINLTTAMFETVDKTKAGYGDEAPIHEFADALNSKTKISTYPITGTGNGEVTDSGIEGLSSDEEVISNKTAMQSAGVAALYGGGLVNPNDPSVQSFNLTSSINRIMGGIGVSMGAYEGCLVAKAGANAVSAIADGIEIVGCISGILASIPTAGFSLTACGPLVGSFFKDLATSVGLGVLLNGVISLLLPTVANMLMRDIVSDLGGEELGNALTLGANMYQGSAHRSNGGSLGTIDKYTKFAVSQKQVMAEKARYERETLSPFDMTSKNTFMGTLLTQMMSFSHADSVSSIVSAGGSAVVSSIAALSPGAMAYDVAESLPDSIEEYEKTCPYLASIGAIGDSYCNPYIVTDMGTMDKDPDEVLEKVRGYGGFSNDSGDNAEIDAGSDLAKYIRYCDNRNSPFGIADQNIAGEVGNWADVSTSNATFNAAANSAIGFLPVIGDIVDIVQNTQQLNNIGYISGESCVAGNDFNGVSTPSWNKAKYYQRFIEDQSLAESMGVIEKSAVTSYLEKYYEENPLDNSYEGILARYSGLTKENVIAILDFIDYADYVAHYDPSERYAFGASVVELENEIFFEQENVMDGEGVLLGQIVYADVRNRSFAV